MRLNRIDPGPPVAAHLAGEHRAVLGCSAREARVDARPIRKQQATTILRVALVRELGSQTTLDALLDDVQKKTVIGRKLGLRA